VHRDVAPVIAAQALLAQGTSDDAVVAYVRSRWRLDPADARAAVAAAHTLLGHDRGIGIATNGKPTMIPRDGRTAPT
jgi:hypothetical protein